MVRINSFLFLFIVCYYCNLYSQKLDQNDNYSPLERFNNKDYISFRDYIQRNAFFPPEAFKTTGVLLAGFTLKTDGKIGNVFTLNSLSQKIDKQIISLIESSSGFWEPPLDNSDPTEDTIIFPIVYCLKNTEYFIQNDNFKLDLQERITLTALVGQEQMSANGYRKSFELKKDYYELLRKGKLTRAKDILYELIRRDPLNTDYYTELVLVDLKLRNHDMACKNLEFIKSYLVKQSNNERITNLKCE